LHHAVVAGLVGLVFLGSVAIGKPILLLIARRVAGNSRQQAAMSRIEAPGVRRSMTRLTLYIGIVALVDALLQTALAVLLPTSSFVVATTVVHVAVVAGAVALALLFIWLRMRGTV
jgi:hypothetical protein